MIMDDKPISHKTNRAWKTVTEKEVNLLLTKELNNP
jgi:hypothetical protein